MERSGIITLVVIALLIAAGIVYFKFTPGNRDGLTIFKQEGCVKCHVYDDVGIGVIDLTDVTQRRSDTWIRDQIRTPRKHDRGSGMPSFDHLSDDELDNLIEFLHEGK